MKRMLRRVMANMMGFVWPSRKTIRRLTEGTGAT
jgi:hypothetical protein